MALATSDVGGALLSTAGVPFFKGFKWAVPLAFSDAVARCHFEEGDILYDAQEAYDLEWQTAEKHARYSLQIRCPHRVSSRISAGKSDDSIKNERNVFARNWISKVILDLYDLRSKTPADHIETTEGRLYTALWSGDLAILEGGGPEPPIPLSAHQAARCLTDAYQAARRISVGYPVFVMPRDLSNIVSWEKYEKVSALLKGHLAGEPKLLTPQSAGLSQWAAIAPTVEIAFFPVNGMTSGELYDMVKQAIYRPAKGTKRQSFRLSAHGAIF